MQTYIKGYTILKNCRQLLLFSFENFTKSSSKTFTKPKAVTFLQKQATRNWRENGEYIRDIECITFSYYGILVSGKTP